MMKIIKSSQKVKSVWKKCWFSDPTPEVYGLYTHENVDIYGRPLSHIVYIFLHIHELSYQHVYFVGCMCYADESLNYNEKVNFEDNMVICYFYIYNKTLALVI